MISGVNATRIVADGVIGPTAKIISALCGVILEGAGTAGTASIYDGVDATGTLIYVIDVAATSTQNILHDVPIAINSGQIFVDLGTTDPTAATILWK